MDALVTVDMGLSVCQTSAVFHLGDVVRKLRNARGWSQSDLGEKADLNKDTVKRIEAGEKPRVDSLERIASALGMTVGQLYGSLLQQSGRDVGLAGDPEIEISDEDVTNYKRDDIPVIQEGEASPNGYTWDNDAQTSQESERTSRPYDFRESGAYAVVLRGDSMEPILKRGMRLIVSVHKAISDGDLVYVQLKSGERLAKIATRVTDGWLLTSANPSHPPRQVNVDEIAHIHKVAYVRFLK